MSYVFLLFSPSAQHFASAVVVIKMMMSVPYFLLNRWVSLKKTFTNAATVNIDVLKKHIL